MSRLIDADEIYKKIIQAEDLARDRVISTENMIGDRVNPMFTRYCAQLDEQSAFKYMIADAPTVEAEPVRHGKWTVTPVYIKCSECGESFMLIPQKYCPNCGARMDAE
jgi:rubrerythrin